MKHCHDDAADTGILLIMFGKSAICMNEFLEWKSKCEREDISIDWCLKKP